MNRSQLVEEWARDCRITVSEAEAYLKNLTELIYRTLKMGDVVQWQGFGKFSVFHGKATIRKNPRTGLLMEVPPYLRPKFVAGERFRKVIKGK